MSDDKSTLSDDLELELSGEQAKPVQTEAKATESNEPPEKYKGKNVDDLIAMHMNAEKALSRQGNELAEVRRLADTIIGLKLPQDNAKEQKQERKPVTVEALLDNPEVALTRAVETSSVARTAETAVNRVNDLERRLAHDSFEKNFPKYKDDIADPQFGDWVKKNPARSALAMAADKFDFTAASSLWGMWNEHKELVGSAATKEQADTTARKAATIKSGPMETRSDPVYSRAKLMELRLRAHEGDSGARAKLDDPEFNRKLVQAYADGRVR